MAGWLAGWSVGWLFGWLVCLLHATWLSTSSFSSLPLQVIDGEVSKGIPPSKIVLGGFSMGGTILHKYAQITFLPTTHKSLNFKPQAMFRKLPVLTLFASPCPSQPQTQVPWQCTCPFHPRPSLRPSLVSLSSHHSSLLTRSSRREQSPWSASPRSCRSLSVKPFTILRHWHVAES